MTTATAFTISHTTEQEILAELEVEFEDFRSRIALLSVEAIGTLTDMFSPLGPEEEVQIIDIDAIEWDHFEQALATPAVSEQDAIIMEFVAAA